MSLHPTAFDYVKPTPKQVEKMDRLREAVRKLAGELEVELVDGPDKIFIIRELRTLAMWINTTVVRQADGTPR